MNNYKMIIQYNGSTYAGWQRQKNADTVQQRIEEAIKIYSKEEINLTGSGRTDAGVHAFGQTANFKIEKELDLFRFHYAVNSMLPRSIAIKEIEKVSENFHSRFDAKKRSYLYFIASKKSPFFYEFSYELKRDLNIQLLNKLAKTLLGKNDFTSFARKKTETENKFCNIYNISFRTTKGFTIFFIEADRFLHGMVRTILGTLLLTANKSYDEKFLLSILKAKDRESAGEAVPAKGLFLYKVKY